MKGPSCFASDRAALAASVEALHAAPGDLDALAEVCAGLEAHGERAQACRAYDVLGRMARELGQPALALAASRALARTGDAPSGAAAARAVAAAYAAGSPRTDASIRQRPPAPPQPGGKTAAAGPGSCAAGPPSDWMAAAAASVARAAVRASEIERAAPRLPVVPLLGALDAAALAQLAEAMQLLTPKAGERILELGEEASALYLIARGAVAVARGEHDLGSLRAGAFFGEIALLVGTRRTARVTCVEDAWLLAVPREAIEKAAAQAPGLADTLAAFARRRLLATTMRTSEIFRRLEPAERDRLMGQFAPRIFAPGAAILRQGQEGDRLHVVVSGEVEVRRGGSAIAVLQAGDVFGEMSLLGRKPATADVVAQSSTVTLSLDRPSFDEVAMSHPAILAEVYRILVARDADHVHVVGDEDVVV